MMASQKINKEGSEPKLKRFIEIGVAAGAINSGDGREGCYCGTRDFQIIIDKIKDGVVSHVVFDTRENLEKFLKQLKAEDLGISVVVTGVFETVHKCCRDNGITPHTVNLSLGVHGKTEKLPKGKLLDIMTMCGHAMVTADLIWHYVERIKKDAITAEEAALRLGALCICGIFNPTRCAIILNELAQGKE
jgi:uncharacterized protein YfcZ (UPF0381/DUF406 family)